MARLILFLIIIGILLCLFSIGTSLMPLLTKEKTAVSPFVIKIKNILAKPATTSKKEVIGFLPSWSVASEEKVYPQYLSQIIYFGLGVTEQGDLITQNEKGEPVLEWTYFTSDYFKKVREEAAKNNTKVLISIKNFDNESIDNLISNQIATDRFIKQLTNLINKYSLDGVNVDFEYVTDTEFPTSKYFVGFMEELSSQLKKDDPKNIISIDVNVLAVVKDKAYNMTKISKVVDQVILMAYDFRQASSTIAGPTSPIVGGPNEHSIAQSLDALSDRVPNEKLILAIPFYGYEWQTENADFKSPTIAESGSLATLKRVKELLYNRKDIKVNWDELSKSPWITFTENGVKKQIYYEDDKSIAEKIKFIKEKNLGGVGIWALGYEDGVDPFLTIEKEMGNH